MESVDIEGDSIDDAIARALQRLGVSRDKVEIEIVSNATRGLFGFGGKRARVRARLRSARSQDGVPAVSPVAPAPSVERRDPPAAPPASAAPSVQAPRPTAERPPPAPRGAAARPAKPAPPPRAAKPQRQPQRPGPRPERPRASAPPRAPAPPPRPDVPPSPESMARGQSVLAELVRLVGLDAAVRIDTDAEGTRLVIDGDPDGVLIGRRGQTLDALEYVVNRIVGHDDDSPTRLVVDVQGYRARRREALQALANRLAERARRRGKPVTLNPMSPRDRRIVHMALQGDPTVTTRSAGSGHFRKLVIVPNRKQS